MYQDVLTTLSASAATTREVAIPRLARIWEFVIWSLIFNDLQGEDQRIRDANVFGNEAGKASNFIRHAIRWLLNRFGKTDTQLASDLEDLIASPTIEAGKKAVLEITRHRPLIIAFDTLENYAVHDEEMVRATAALIECAATFCPTYAKHNLHLKLFIMAEVFPYLMDEAIPNTLKHVKDEIYLIWRPKDLMRLLSWRLAAFLRLTSTRSQKGSSKIGMTTGTFR